MGGIYWLASYPKSGNTWFRALLMNLKAGGAAPCEINKLDTGAIASCRSWIDETLGLDTADLTSEEIERLRPGVYRWSAREQTISYHKIHDAYILTDRGEPLTGQEGTLGAVYIIRNPLDIVLSAASHWRMDLDKTIECMGMPGMELSNMRKGLSGQVRQKLLSWSGHVSSWVDAPDLACLVVRYEDMLAVPHPTLTRAARFLGLPDDIECIDKAVRFSAFDELSRQENTNGFRECPPSVRRFFRRGTSGGWRDVLSPSQVDRIIADHSEAMIRFGYLDAAGRPL